MTKKFMQPTLIAGAVLALTAGVAQAQSSVTVYGIVDAGIQHTDKANAAGDSVTEVNNGGRLPSIWGFKGTEDLGGGLKASFNLEGDFDSSTGGTRGLGAGGSIFPRQANVGLSGGFGSILIGRQYSVALLAELGVDPRGYKESFSSLSTYALTQAPGNNANTGNNTLGIFTGNAVSYSNAFGPVKVGVMYGLGEKAGDNSAGTTTAIGLSYSGPITVAGSYQQIKALSSSTAKTERYAIGAAVPFGDLAVKAIYANSKQDDATGTEVSKIDNYGVGVDFKWNAQNTATAAYYNGKEKRVAGNGTTSSFVLSNDYSLSKRTTIYAQYLYTDRELNAPGGTTLNFGGTPAGKKASQYGVGITHTF